MKLNINIQVYLNCPNDVSHPIRWVEDDSLVDDSFTNWQDGRPRDSESLNCMWSQGGGNIGSWLDEACTTSSYAICSKPIAAAGESSTLYPPLVPCPFECPAESGYFEVEPCGAFYCSCTNFDGYLQVCTQFIWALLTMLKGNEATNHSNDSLRSLCWSQIS